MSSPASIDSTAETSDEQYLSKSPRRTPLPKFQLFIVFLIQFAEPITATVIYPFVNKFVRETGITGGDERKTGYYAGLIESSFFFAEALTVFLWGRASDIYGRRPILLLGPVGLSLAALSFGMSKRFWPLVASRCMQGVFNGNIGVSKSVMGELTDSTNIADAMAMMPVIWTFGVFIGPIIGGLLSSPAESWPELFGGLRFFYEYPYFLPCAVASAISFVTAFIAFFGLKETLPSAISQEENKTIASDSSPEPTTKLLNGPSVADYGSSPTKGPATTSDIPAGVSRATNATPSIASLLVPRIIFILVAYAALAFVDMGCGVLQPLVYSTSPKLGGLGLEPYSIGSIMGTWGIVNSFVQLTFLGRAIKRFGPRNIFIVSLISYTIVLCLYPLLGFLVKRSGRADGPVWVVLCIQLLFCIPNIAAFASIQVIIVTSAPSSASLGTLNGMAQAVSSSMRSIGPSIASSLFSISLERQLLGGNLTYLVLASFGLLGVSLGFLLPDYRQI